MVLMVKPADKTIGSQGMLHQNWVVYIYNISLSENGHTIESY